MGHPAHAFPEPDRSRFRHRPESTVLYQAVAGHWPAFLERAEEHGGLPRFVVQEFEEFLRCGRPERRRRRVRVRRCVHSVYVLRAARGARVPAAQ